MESKHIKTLHITLHQENANSNNKDIQLHAHENGQIPEQGQQQVLPRIQRNRESLSLLLGIQNGTASLKDGLAISYKTKHTLITQSSNSTP